MNELYKRILFSGLEMCVSILHCFFWKRGQSSTPWCGIFIWNTVHKVVFRDWPPKDWILTRKVNEIDFQWKGNALIINTIFTGRSTLKSAANAFLKAHCCTFQHGHLLIQAFSGFLRCKTDPYRCLRQKPAGLRYPHPSWTGEWDQPESWA